MHLWRGNSFTDIHGAPDWFLTNLRHHLSIPISFDVKTGERFGSKFMNKGEWYGSLIDGNRVTSGLTWHVEQLAKYYHDQGYHLPCEVFDRRERPSDQLPLFSVQAKWRPYQDIIHKTIAHYGIGVVDAPPRSGKTLMAARAVDTFAVPTLYIAPTVAIVSQTYKVLSEAFGEDMVARLDGAAHPSQRDISKMIVVATAPSAVRQKKEFYDTRDLLIVDEFHHCISPYANVLTLSGEKVISEIREGELVATKTDNGVGFRKVLNVWKRKAPDKLLRLHLSTGRILEITDEHNIYTPTGKIKTGDLRVGSEVCVFEMREDNLSEGAVCNSREILQRAKNGLAFLRKLWKENFSQIFWGAQRILFGNSQGIRRSGISETSYDYSFEKYGVSKAFIGTYAETEFESYARRAGENDKRISESNCRRSCCALWQRVGRKRERGGVIRKESVESFEAVRFYPRVCYSDGFTQESRQFALVSTRFCSFGEEDCGRNRWEFSCASERCGCAEGRFFNSEQVGRDSDSCEFYRSESSVVTARVLKIETVSSKSETVYDLEVEETHNYFVEGMLVSNSAAETYHKINKLADNIYYRLCFTGTHWRTGGDRLAMEAVCSQVLYRLEIADLIPKYLVQPFIYYIPFRDKVVRGKDWREAYVNGIVECEARNARIVSTANQLVDNGIPTIVLVQRRAHADFLGEIIPDSRVAKGGEGILTSNTIKKFLGGEFFCLIGTSVLGEGVDLPNAAALIYAGGGGDSVHLMQSYFRPFTAYPDKDLGRVYDFKDLHHPTLQRHSTARINCARRFLGDCVYTPE